MALTDTEIRKSRPAEKAYKLSDSGGLHLLDQSFRRPALALEVPIPRQREANVVWAIPGFVSRGCARTQGCSSETPGEWHRSDGRTFGGEGSSQDRNGAHLREDRGALAGALEREIRARATPRLRATG